MKTRYILVVAFFICFWFKNGSAQNDFTLYNTPGVFQRIYVNPAFKTERKVHIGIPVISNIQMGLGNSGFSLNNLITVRPDDSLALSIDNVIGKLGNDNFLSLNSQIDLFSLGFHLKKAYISFNISERINSRFTYPKDMVVLGFEGNGASLLGQRASLDNLGLNLNLYREIGMGISLPINNKLTLGARAKLLSGHLNLQTKQSKFGLTTQAETFDLTLDGSAEVNVSGLVDLLDDKVDFEELFLENNNAGIAFDFGADYKINDKVSASVSVLDLGFINWKNYVNNYKINNFNYTFSGVELGGFLDGETTNFDEVLDSLNGLFKANRTKNSYSTALSTRSFIGINYNVTSIFSASGLIYTEFFDKNIRQAYTIGGTAKLKDWLSFTTNYTVYNGSYNNIGLGLMVRGGAGQFFVTTDNIIAAFSPEGARNAHFRFGLNLVFGKSDIN